MKRIRGFAFNVLPISLAVVPPILPRQCSGDGFPGHKASGGASATGGVGPAGGSTIIAGGTDAGSGGTSTSDIAGASSSFDAGVAGASAATGGLTSVSSSSGAPICGNGALDPGEVCDEGAQNGSAGHCDATCAFACTGACPVRVDPAAINNGSGRNWADATNNLQAAINAQAASGGGEVWVRSGDYSLSAISAGNAISVGSSVTLRGGFAGTETTSAQRTSGQSTNLHGAGAGSSSAVLTIASAVNVVVDEFTLSDGDPDFAITNGSSVLLNQVTASVNAANPTTHSLVIADSTVDIEHCGILMPRNSNGLALSNSNVAIKNSTVSAPAYPDGESYGGIPVLSATAGRLLLQSSHSDSGTYIGVGAEALIVRSALNKGTSSLGPSLSVSGSAALLDNQIGAGVGYPPVYTTGSLLVFDSNFAATRTTNAHGYYPAAWGIDGSGSLEVSLSTFGAGYCDYADANCGAVFGGNINNSRFASDNVVTRQSTPPSNCVGSSCTDLGDESLLNASHARLMAFAVPFLVAPFNAELTEYSDPGFWRCTDSNAPDPGYHTPCSP